MSSRTSSVSPSTARRTVAVTAAGVALAGVDEGVQDVTTPISGHAMTRCATAARPRCGAEGFVPTAVSRSQRESPGSVKHLCAPRRTTYPRPHDGHSGRAASSDNAARSLSPDVRARNAHRAPL